MTNPIDREALARRIGEALLPPHINTLDLVTEAASTVVGLADLLASHGAEADCHGFTVSGEQLSGAASAIHHQAKLIRAVVEHLEAERRQAFVSKLSSVGGGAA